VLPLDKPIHRNIVLTSTCIGTLFIAHVVAPRRHAQRRLDFFTRQTPITKPMTSMNTPSVGVDVVSTKLTQLQQSLNKLCEKYQPMWTA
jgi:hypothetical protein